MFKSFVNSPTPPPPFGTLGNEVTKTYITIAANDTSEDHIFFVKVTEANQSSEENVVDGYNNITLKAGTFSLVITLNVLVLETDVPYTN